MLFAFTQLCENVWDHDDRCLFVEEFCSEYSAGMINYLHLYFCKLESAPALALIIMTGVTFLAFGNASPDIFSTFSAVSAGSGTLAIGEVIAYVMIAIFDNWKHQRAERQPEVIGEVYSEQRQSYSQNSTVNERSTEHRQEDGPGTQRALVLQEIEGTPSTSSHQLVTSTNIESTVAPIDNSYNPILPSRRCPAIVISTTQHSPGQYQGAQERQRGYITVSRSSSDENSPIESTLCDATNQNRNYAQFQHALLHHLLILPDRSDPMNRPRSPIFQEPPGGSFQDSFPKMSLKQRCRIVFNDWIKPVYFPTLIGWNDKTWFFKTLAVGSIPIVLLLALTLPVVVVSETRTQTSSLAHEEQDNGGVVTGNTTTDTERKRADQSSLYSNWCRVATMVQMVIAPVFMAAVVTNAADEGYYAIFVALGVGLLLSAMVFFFSSEEDPPRFYEALAFVGFLVAMTWIFIVANEVVGILQGFGMILGVSDAILGLTVFAMGNSLGDLVANTTIARMGFPRMAFSACFGGPLIKSSGEI
ncbi:hypothetical protein BG011_008229 [Mortierella polycephala]|uniref:Sodium/calcium exchanger membrane region domain-containing protein n=1 Tax=Mortierella polycephala TaxID=41804 RepID=A0A9P6QBU9_9FUNG|nr:hypothetical protein BG011_008229 [Mortierella polycephala]